MSDMSPSENPFDVLDLSLETDDRAVRKSYARKIREARAAGDPDSIQRVQQAFESIRDEEARRRLRRQLAGRARVEPLVDEARAAADAGDFNQANILFRRLLEEAPENENALLAYHAYQCSRERYDRAAKAARVLTRIAPGEAAHWRLCAETLFCLATESETDETCEERARFALKYVRRARELGDDCVEVSILESRILWVQGRRQLATNILRERLDASGELRTEELQAGIELLRLHGGGGNRLVFNDTLDTIAGLLPECEDRRRTIAVSLCDLASEMSEDSLPLSIACVELAEICRPTDPDIVEFATSLRESQGSLTEDIAEKVSTGQVELPEADTGESVWSRWPTWILAIVVIRLLIFGIRQCSG